MPNIEANIVYIGVWSYFLTNVYPTDTQKNGNKIGVIVGVVVGATVLGLAILARLYVWRHKKRKVSLEQQGRWYARLT